MKLYTKILQMLLLLRRLKILYRWNVTSWDLNCSFFLIGCIQQRKFLNWQCKTKETSQGCRGRKREHSQSHAMYMHLTQKYNYQVLKNHSYVYNKVEYYFLPRNTLSVWGKTAIITCICNSPLHCHIDTKNATIYTSYYTIHWEVLLYLVFVIIYTFIYIKTVINICNIHL